MTAYYPWVEEKLEELDAETPVLFDETEGIDFEAVADTAPRRDPGGVLRPDQGGLRDAEQDRARGRLPRGCPGATSMDDMIKLDSPRLSAWPRRASSSIADLDARVAEAGAEHPEIQGKVAMITHTDVSDLSQVHFYTSHTTCGSVSSRTSA